MDSIRFKKLRSLHEQALDLAPEDRRAFLMEVCGSDASLRRDLEAMLAVADKTFLEPPREWEESIAGRDDSSPAAVPERIGPYRLVRVLGAGGMGIVYEARQESPRRRVALKVLSGGHQTELRRRRFREEAEFLARLNHTGIAQVYDSGVHESELGAIPYFVMEFVPEARDFLTYANQECPTISSKLEAFLLICEAVHHAHQNQVIHRDLKAANVLVSEEGILKVIDYGIARQLDAEELTRDGEVLGTLQNMAPEQIPGDSQAVDTRTDIYALGLLFYELIYGIKPLDVAGKSFDDMVRIIREVPPTDPRYMGSKIPHDLGWIALKALEKEPSRRYASVSEFAADIRRFAAHEPVDAGPPSTSYRLHKFVRRNRIAVTAAVGILLALIAGLTMAIYGLMQARTENDKFRSINEVLAEIFISPREDRDGFDVLASTLIDRASARLAEPMSGKENVEAPLRSLLARTYLSLGRAESAEREARRGLALFEQLQASDETERMYCAGLLAQALFDQRRLRESREIVDEYLPHATQIPLEDSASVLQIRGLHAELLAKEGQEDEAVTAAESLWQDCLATLGPDHAETDNAQYALVRRLNEAERHQVAEEYGENILRRRRRLYGDIHPKSLTATVQLAQVVARQERYSDALSLLDGVHAGFVETYGVKHPKTWVAETERGMLLLSTGELGSAMQVLTRAVENLESIWGEDHPRTVTARFHRARTLMLAGREEAVEELRFVYESRRQQLGPQQRETLNAHFELACQLKRRGEFDEAESLLLEYRLLLPKSDSGSRRTFQADQVLAAIYSTTGRLQEALELQRTSIPMADRLFGFDRPERFDARLNGAATLERLGQLEEALQWAVEAHEGFGDLFDAHHRDVLKSSMAKVRLLWRLGKKQEALEVAEQSSTEIREQGPRGPDGVRALYVYADCLRGNERREEALEIFEEVVDALENGVQSPQPEQALFRRDYGRCLWELGELEEAEEVLALSFEIEEELAGVTETRLAPLRKELVRLLRRLGRDAEAQELEAESGGS